MFRKKVLSCQKYEEGHLFEQDAYYGEYGSCIYMGALTLSMAGGKVGPHHATNYTQDHPQFPHLTFGV